MIRQVQGIDFEVTDHGSVWIGHAWVKDETSGMVFACVSEGKDWPKLEADIQEMLSDCEEHARSGSGLDPKLVGGGTDPRNPPT